MKGITDLYNLQINMEIRRQDHDTLFMGKCTEYSSIHVLYFKESFNEGCMLD